jgi:uncharacterized protein (DUF302 family)
MRNNMILSSITLVLALFFSGCTGEAPAPKAQVKAEKIQTIPDIRIITGKNVDGKITKESVEAAFKANGFEISANNDMSKSFKGKFGEKDPTAGTDFLVYRLMPVYHEELSIKLIKDYPEFGIIAPISTSVYSKDGKEWSISSLSLKAMSRITSVPENNADLIALYAQLTKALEEAIPGGTFKDLKYKILRPDGELITRFAFKLPNPDGDIEEAMEAYEEQMEGEASTVGFVFPVFTEMTEDVSDVYEFYKTVSVCNLDVIYPVHKNHPEVGAYAPCTMYKYKKKGDKMTRMGYASVHNWTIGTEIEDEYSLEPLIKAQDLLEATIDATIEE